MIAALIVLAVRFRSLGRRGLRLSLVALGICTAFSLVLAIPYIEVAREGRQFVQSADEVAGLGADFTKSENRLSIWGDVLDARRPVGAPSFPGVGLLLLAAVGTVSGLRGTGKRRQVVVLGSVLVAVGAFLALGTSSSGWRAYSPYRLLFEFVPLVKVLRAAARAWVIGVLGLGLLAGIGAAAVHVEPPGCSRRTTPAHWFRAESRAVPRSVANCTADALTKAITVIPVRRPSAWVLSWVTIAVSISGSGKPNSMATNRWRVDGFSDFRMF